MDTLLIAIWGAALSTGLFVIKIREYWKGRFKLHLSLGINNVAQNTNVITITNDFKNSITVESLELFWSKKVRGESKNRYIRTQFEQDCFFSIPAYSSKQLKFDEENYFGIRSDIGNLYIRINIVGRKRPFIKILYPL